MDEKQTILIIDDIKQNIDTLTSLLQNYNLLTASDKKMQLMCYQMKTA